MEKFQFTVEHKSPSTTVFNGPVFYNVYKDADFLRVDANIESILSSGYLLRQKVNSVPIGHSILIEGMHLERNTPLIVKRAGEGVTVEDFEFTYNRLAGLVAAYTFENRNRFPVIESSEAKFLGLVWDNGNEEKCRLYLSAVSGTDNMIDQFSFFPLLCGIRKYQLNKMPLNLVIGMGNIKNNTGITMAKLLMQNMIKAKRIWLMFPNTTVRDLETIIMGTPKLKKIFLG